MEHYVMLEELAEWQESQSCRNDSRNSKTDPTVGSHFSMGLTFCKQKSGCFCFNLSF